MEGQETFACPGGSESFLFFLHEKGPDGPFVPIHTSCVLQAAGSYVEFGVGKQALVMRKQKSRIKPPALSFFFTLT